ncbi:hypothetical protein [Streptomyces sp. NPDC054865]
MDDELASPGDPTSWPHRDRDEHQAATGGHRLAVDDHTFSVLAPSGPATCRLQLFTAAGIRPVALVTQVFGEGMGLTNAVEAFAGAAWERHCPDEDLPPVWIQHQLWPPEMNELPVGFERVDFTDTDRYRPRTPRWTPITREELQDLVGAPVDASRGTGYEPRPAEPEPLLVFSEFAVTALARPRPFREPDCMPAGVTWWRRWLRQVWPVRATSSCCWYHGGDWHAVNEMALHVLREAPSQGVEPEEMKAFAVEYATAQGAVDWQKQALATLFSVADAIQPNSEGGYINGQHRSQVMMEAGVRRTVVLRHVYDA